MNFVDSDEVEEKKYKPREDSQVQKAVEILRNHFLNIRRKPIQTPYYQSQLEILYESDFFPWVIKNALDILEEDGFLISFHPTIVAKSNIKPPKFFANKQALKENKKKNRNSCK